MIALGLILALLVSVAAPSPEGTEEKLPALEYVDGFPKPAFLEGIGNSQLKITTSSPEAQRYFNQGLSLLHCFWDFEALRAFRQVVRLDPDAAMGYWGLYMALQYNRALTGAERKSVLIRAEELAANISEHEQFYIRAARFQEDGEQDAYRSEMEALVDRYPDDVEAQLFLALRVMSGYDSEGRPRPGQIYSQSLLRNLLETHPDHHGVHHYWIHATETSQRPYDSIHSADRMKELAPASGHIVHMAGHIYYQVGDYETAYRAFTDSMAADKAYMARFEIEPVDTWNYIHNLDYLVANCAEDGRYAEGEQIARLLQGLRLSEEGDAMDRSHFVSRRGKARMIRARFAWAEFYLRYGRWDRVIEAMEQIDNTGALLDEPAEAYRRQVTRFARAMAAIDSGQLDEAARLADAMDAELWREQQASGRGRRGGAENSMLVVYSMELQGRLAAARGDYEGGVAKLEAAVERRRELGEGEPPLYAKPVEETLAAVHLKAGKYAAAREAYAAVLERRPHSGHALYGVARSYELEGDLAAARKAYGDFLKAWRYADRDLPEVRHAVESLGN